MKKQLKKKKAALSAKKLIKIIAELAEDKKAEDIVVLDMRKIVNFCDYFIICTGNNDRHVQAIALAIEEGLGEKGLNSGSRQGKGSSAWLVIDIGHIVTHVFRKDLREFYGLEYLWKEAKRLDWEK